MLNYDYMVYRALARWFFTFYGFVFHAIQLYKKADLFCKTLFTVGMGSASTPFHFTAFFNFNFNCQQLYWLTESDALDHIFHW